MQSARGRGPAAGRLEARLERRVRREGHRPGQVDFDAGNGFYDYDANQWISGGAQRLPSGLPIPKSTKSVKDTPQEERNAIFEEAWEKGGMFLNNAFYDITMDPKSNELVSEFIRSKIREKVKKSDIVEDLLPNYYYATKRPILDTNYWEVYNEDHVTLVNLREQPIERITENGIQTTLEEYDLDIIVYATGYDAMTGTLLKLDIQGRDGLTLKEKWENGARVDTYLGLGIAGFPNFFTITGPQSPSVLTNVPTAIEQHVEWISDCLLYLRENNVKTF